jgi:hypothetical protein
LLIISFNSGSWAETLAAVCFVSSLIAFAVDGRVTKKSRRSEEQP